MYLHLTKLNEWTKRPIKFHPENQNYDVGNVAVFSILIYNRFLSGQLHLSVFLVRHITLITTLRQSD